MRGGTDASKPANAVEPDPAVERQVGPPNIVLILTDDQRWDTLWAMPQVQERLVAHGVTFANAFYGQPRNVARAAPASSPAAIPTPPVST